MKLNTFFFSVTMAGAFALSVGATIYFIPEPRADLAPAVNLICLSVAVFSAGILGYGAGVIREAKKIEARILADLRREWDERVYRLPPGAEVAAGVAAVRPE